MSWAVTTLFLGLGAWGLGLGLGLGLRRGSRALVVVTLLDVVVLVFLHDARHVHHQVARRQVHDLHTLRVAAGNPNPLHRHADHDSLLGNHHQLIVGHDLL